MRRVRNVNEACCLIAFGTLAAMLGGCASLLASGTPGTAAAAGPALAAGATSVTVPSPSSLDYVGPSTKILLLSPEAFMVNSTQLDRDVIEEQCRFHTPDPPLMVPNEQDKGWTFAGRLNPGRRMEALEYRRILLPGVSGPEQVSTWPVKLETLSAMSDTFLTNHMTVLENASLPPAQEQALAEEYLRESAKIQQAIDQLERNYDPQRECPGEGEQH